MSKWVVGKIIDMKHWTDQLFTIVLRAPIDTFVAGQFSRIGITINGVIIQRAYSYLNAPNNPNLEFYITTVKSGKLSPYLRSLCPGNMLMLTKESYGYFILDKIPDCRDLWMLATGTGIGPYLSILAENDKKLDKFSNIVLVHATTYAKNLNYLSKMIELQKIYHNKLRIQIVLSQEESAGFLCGRIPELIENNFLESEIGLNLSIYNSHVMLCGHPNMIRDTKEILKKRYGMKSHIAHEPGHITQERYW